ncbi:MAG TPA: HNH endonuclease [Aquimonas sp.]|nr:HNH endonuclease [Aquimonas sp.]HRF54044.1 HNH endonuclease [Aquimonas sp.]
MRPALCRLFLCALRHDAEAQGIADGWETRCLHCRARLQFARSGEPLGAGSLEHVIPQAWFGKRAASTLCASVDNDPNHPRNLAVACGRCNQSKGKGPDARGPADPRALQVITTMLARRQSRWRTPS